MTEFLIDSIFVQFGGCRFHQVIGIPVGTNCAPLLADFSLYSYENESFEIMIQETYQVIYIIDTLMIQFLITRSFWIISEINPSQLAVEKANILGPWQTTSHSS